jgi:hypothetical protein
MRLLILSLILIFSLCSCSALKLLKASEAKGYGFIPKNKSLKMLRDPSPFQRRWVTKKISDYKKLKTDNFQIYIAKVNTKIVKQMLIGEFKEREEREERNEEVKLVAEYFNNKLAQEIKRLNPNVTILGAPNGNSLCLKIALVEVEPTNPAINLIGTAAGLFLPGGGLIKIAGKGGVAIEGFFENTRNSKLILESFKDRESDKAAPFTVKDFQKYAHIRIAIDDWSTQIAEILAKPISDKVEDSLPFSLSIFG